MSNLSVNFSLFKGEKYVSLISRAKSYQVMTLSITNLILPTLSLTTAVITTLSIVTLNTMTFSIRINMRQCILSVVMLRVVYAGCCIFMLRMALLIVMMAFHGVPPSHRDIEND
jgi:hypothetical protein